jgi:hypothetical protein
MPGIGISKPEGKREIKRHRSRWDYNIKINLRKTE